MLNEDKIYTLLMDDRNPTWTCWLDPEILRELSHYIAVNYREDTPVKKRTDKKKDENFRYFLLPEKDMQELGFEGKWYAGTRYETDSPMWSFYKSIVFPKSIGFEDDYIFVCEIQKDGSDGKCYVKDVDGDAPYDYMKRADIVAKFVREQAEEWIEYLIKGGVLQRK